MKTYPSPLHAVLDLLAGMGGGQMESSFTVAEVDGLDPEHRRRIERTLAVHDTQMSTDFVEHTNAGGTEVMYEVTSDAWRAKGYYWVWFSPVAREPVRTLRLY